MIREVITCDHCKKTIPTLADAVTVEIQAAFRKVLNQGHICRTCAPDLLKFLDWELPKERPLF